MTILALETTAKAASCAVLREGAPLATACLCSCSSFIMASWTSRAFFLV